MDEDLWALIEPLLPPWPDRSPGPRPVPDRLCLQGILFVLHNDIAWQLLPPPVSCCGLWMTCAKPRTPLASAPPCAARHSAAGLHFPGQRT
ncbi:transposase [Streptomyces cyaneofuscatus]